MLGIETLRKLAARAGFHVLLKPPPRRSNEKSLDELKKQYEELARRRKPGPFDDKYIDHENED